MANGRQHPADIDRQRGIFTERDRRFLLGELDDELDANEKRQKRYRLRQRVFHAIQDLSYLSTMETGDLFQVTTDIDHVLRQEPPEDLASDEARAASRLREAFAETISLFYYILDKELVWTIEREVAATKAVSHYDETGNYGAFDVEMSVELREEMTIDELKQTVKAESLFTEGHSRGYLRPYPGWYQVLDRASPNSPRALVHDEFDTIDVDDPEVDTEQVDSAIEIINNLAAGKTTADVSQVERAIAEREDVSRDRAREIIQGALLAGRCYQPGEEELAVV